MQIIRLGQVTMCCSPALFLEYEDVLKRPDQLAASELVSGDIDAILNELAGIIEPVATPYQWRPQLRDPSDEMVLEAAANAQAQAMTSYALRLPESLKLAAKRIAAADDTTMNQFFVVAIAEKISAMETAKFFEQKAALGKASDAQAAWDKVGTNAAMADDEWSP